VDILRIVIWRRGVPLDIANAAIDQAADTPTATSRRRAVFNGSLSLSYPSLGSSKPIAGFLSLDQPPDHRNLAWRG